MRSEIRFIGVNTGVSTITTAALQSMLNTITQGDDNRNREGSACYMRNLSLNYTCYAGDPAGNTMRVSVVYDKQTSGAPCAEADIWAQTGTPESLRFWHSRSRYVMLYDKVHALDIDKPTTVRVTRKINKFVKFGTATSGLVTNISKGSIYLFVVSDSGAAPSPTFNGFTRISYTP